MLKEIAKNLQNDSNDAHDGYKNSMFQNGDRPTYVYF